MSSLNWTKEDFQVFQIEGLESRMEALTALIRPKFQELGETFAAYFSAQTEDEFFHHVAKHARRTVNPPADSWVAFAPYKRGYKALPHFQIGLWESHIFIVLAVIYEVPKKREMAERLLQNINTIKQLPDHYVLSGDHTSPHVTSLADDRTENLEKLLLRLRDVKKGEFLLGRHLSAEEAVNLTFDEFMQYAEKTFNDLLPIYNIIVGK